MKPSASDIHLSPEQYRVLRLRYEALAADWHRLRDQDAEWRHFQKIVTRAVVAIAALFILGTLTGCDTPEKKCARWDIAVMGYEMCINDPNCRMSEWKYQKLIKAKYERAAWCPEEKL